MTSVLQAYSNYNTRHNFGNAGRRNFYEYQPSFPKTSRSYLSPTYSTTTKIGSGRRSLSLNRPGYQPMRSGYSILDEIIDRRKIPLKDHIDDARYQYEKSRTSSNNSSRCRSITRHDDDDDGDKDNSSPTLSGRASRTSRRRGGICGSVDDDSSSLLSSNSGSEKSVSNVKDLEITSKKARNDTNHRWRFQQPPPTTLKPLFGDRLDCAINAIPDNRSTCSITVVDHDAKPTIIIDDSSPEQLTLDASESDASTGFDTNHKITIVEIPTTSSPETNATPGDDEALSIGRVCEPSIDNTELTYTVEEADGLSVDNDSSLAPNEDDESLSISHHNDESSFTDNGHLDGISAFTVSEQRDIRTTESNADHQILDSSMSHEDESAHDSILNNIETGMEDEILSTLNNKENISSFHDETSNTEHLLIIQCELQNEDYSSKSDDTTKEKEECLQHSNQDIILQRLYHIHDRLNHARFPYELLAIIDDTANKDKNENEIEIDRCTEKDVKKNKTNLQILKMTEEGTKISNCCLKCGEEKCPGFQPHRWRISYCAHCKCPLAVHDNLTLTDEDRRYLVRYLMEKPTTKKIKSLFAPSAASPTSKRHGGAQPHTNVTTSTTTVNHSDSGRTNQSGLTTSKAYTWTPPGLSPAKVEEYMSQLANHKVPRVGTSGEKYRDKQLMLQLPRQDLAAAYCKHLAAGPELAAFEEFVNVRNENSLDIGFVYPSLEKNTECRHCRGILVAGEVAVMAPKLGTASSSSCWHPGCFVCSACDELLVDLTYCVARDEHLFCERHFAETIKPRCGACDELIFAGEYTKAMNQDWHSNHFCCWQCDQVLTGQRYILRDEHPYCVKCYEEVFANTCDECGKPIGIDSKDLSYKEKHWHESCFLCSMCKISLVDKPFGSKNDRIFCANCYDQAFATRCDGCGEIFRAGMKKMEYKGKQWHDKCFCCALCKSPIGTRSFIPKNDEVYCAACYEEKFATRCTKCRKVINSGGVTYKNEPWHRECFCCRNCNVSLAGQRFTSKDDKPYCANCFGELFAKRCTLCTKPITGIGGSKFISFEDRHWHNNCFICAQCEMSLVGQGFITDGPDILCPECAKARLMAQHA